MGLTPLDLISVEDIGEVARTVFLNQSRFLNKTLSICGSKITISEMAHYFTQYLRPLQFKDKPVRDHDHLMFLVAKNSLSYDGKPSKIQNDGASVLN